MKERNISAISVYLMFFCKVLIIIPNDVNTKGPLLLQPLWNNSKKICYQGKEYQANHKTHQKKEGRGFVETYSILDNLSVCHFGKTMIFVNFPLSLPHSRLFPRCNALKKVSTQGNTQHQSPGAVTVTVHRHSTGTRHHTDFQTCQPRNTNPSQTQLVT